MPTQVNPRRVITVDDSGRVTRALTTPRRVPAPPPTPPRPVVAPTRPNPQRVIPIDDEGRTVYVPNYAARGNNAATAEATLAIQYGDNAQEIRREYRTSVTEPEMIGSVQSVGGDSDFLFPSQRAIWRDEIPRNKTLSLVASLSNLAFSFGQSNPWVALGVRIAQGAILDQVFGIDLTANGTTTNGVTNWMAWSPSQVNTTFQAVIQNAEMYNRIASERLLQTISNPVALFRQINGPMEFRYQNVYVMQANGNSTCVSVDQGVNSGNTRLYGLTCTPLMRGLSIPVTLANGELSGAVTWGDLQNLLRSGATVNSADILPTLIHLTNSAFLPGSVRNIDVEFDGIFFNGHELGHVIQENWEFRFPERTLSAEYVDRSDDVWKGDYPLYPGTPNQGARSSLTPDEYLADAIANLATDTFTDTVDGRQRREIIEELLAYLIIQKGFRGD